MAAFRIFDLVCEGQEAHAFPDELVPGTGDIPACPNCGAMRHATWGTLTQAAPTVGFKPITIEGVKYETRESFENYRRAFARNNKVPLDDVVLVGNDDRVVRGEEARHRAWATRKKNGIDEAQLAEHRRDVKMRQSEERGTFQRRHF